MTETTGYQYDVFISYSQNDRVWVQDTLVPLLESAGLRVCIEDRDFELGIPIQINVERVVDQSHHTLLVLTQSWIDSEWREFESLLVSWRDPAGREQRLLPLLLSPCQLPKRIRMLTYADLTKPEEAEAQLDRLVKQLRGRVKSVSLPAEGFSPFVAGPPLTHPRQFFGRGRELGRLFNLWKRLPMQNAAIIGPRRSGKTSLLLYLKNITTTPLDQLRPGQRTDWLPEQERYNWIYADFQDPRLGSQEGLLRYLLASMDLPMPSLCDLERFMDIVGHGLHDPTVVLMDEIGVALKRYPELDEPFWEGLRSLVTNQVSGNLAFVLTASEPPDQLARHSDIGSPFFNIFGYSAVLGPLRESEAQELIADSPIPFSPADVDWILDQSGRWPLLLQILCRERLFALEEGEVGDNWREDGLRQMAPFRHLLEVEQ